MKHLTMMSMKKADIHGLDEEIRAVRWRKKNREAKTQTTRPDAHLHIGKKQKKIKGKKKCQMDFSLDNLIKYWYIKTLLIIIIYIFIIN